MVPAAQRSRAHAGRDRAAGRGRGRALRLRRFQAEGRRDGWRGRDGSDRGDQGALSRRARDARPERRVVARRSRRAMPRARSSARICGGPVRAGSRLLGPRGDGRIPPRDRHPDRDQHDRDGLAADGSRGAAAGGRHSARRSALLDDAGFGAARATVPRLGAHVGFALEQSLRRVAGDVHACGRGGARHDHRDRHALDLAGRRRAAHARAARDRRRPGGRARAPWARDRTRHGAGRGGSCAVRASRRHGARRCDGDAVSGAGVDVRSEAAESRARMTAAERTLEKQKGLGLATEPFEFRWWSGGGSNSRPSHCERDALPAELPPQQSIIIHTHFHAWQ
ncbi:hypothetical protein BDI4_390016 [Burkholderia diffusa]|nr:hypothetical protein BDI4_390016 [Burkholderia diffusa]